MRANTRLVTVATVAAILVAVAVALFAIYLLVIGQTGTLVREVPYGQPLPPGAVVRMPYQPAVAPMLAAVLLIIGLLTKRLSIAWAGLALLFLFSGLAMFSWGLAFLPGAVLLLVLLLVIRATRRTPGRGQPG